MMLMSRDEDELSRVASFITNQPLAAFLALHTTPVATSQAYSLSITAGPEFIGLGCIRI